MSASTQVRNTNNIQKCSAGLEEQECCAVTGEGRKDPLKGLSKLWQKKCHPNLRGRGTRGGTGVRAKKSHPSVPPLLVPPSKSNIKPSPNNKIKKHAKKPAFDPSNYRKISDTLHPVRTMGSLPVPVSAVESSAVNTTTPGSQAMSSPVSSMSSPVSNPSSRVSSPVGSIVFVPPLGRQTPLPSHDQEYSSQHLCVQCSESGLHHCEGCKGSRPVTQHIISQFLTLPQAVITNPFLSLTNQELGAHTDGRVDQI